MANPLNPGAIPGAVPTQPTAAQDYQRLLDQGRQKLAQELIREPTGGEQFRDFMTLFGAGIQGGNEFRQAQQQQIENQRLQQEQLRALIAHEDNLSVAQAQEQRLRLKQIHDRQLEENNYAAGLIEKITGGRPEDVTGLTKWFMSELINAGIDDDDLSYPQIAEAITREYQNGLSEGRYSGPMPEQETFSAGQPIYENGEFVGFAPFAPGTSPEDEQAAALAKLREEYRLKQELEQFKAELPGGDGKIPVNAILPDGTNVLVYEPFTHYEDELGRLVKLPQGSTVLGRDTAYGNVLAAKKDAGIKEALEKLGVDPDKGMFNVSNIQGKFSQEERHMFKAITENPGIGPWSNIKEGLDRVVGGTGIGELMGYPTSSLFPDNSKNRNYLRIAKQFGKSAFILSDRYPTYEQKLVGDFFPDPDEFFANPDTAVYVLADIHDAMMDRQVFHLTSALNAVDQKTKDNHMRMAGNIQAFLRFIGTPDPNVVRKFNLGPGLPEVSLELEPGTIEDGYRFKGGDPSDKNNWEKVE